MNKVAQVTNTEQLTPIEIALSIDNDGFTTARALYEWLQLDPSHYARWAKQNITENVYAVENEDYFPFAINGERAATGVQPNPTTDYKISANLAKKICMTVKTQRGESARDYFLGCEHGLKMAIGEIKALRAELADVTEKINNLVASTATSEYRITCLESGTSVSGCRISPWVKQTSADIMELAKFCDCTIKEMYSRIISRMEDIYGIFFQRYFDEYAATHPNEKPIWRIIVIEYYDLKEAFEDTYIKIGREVGLYHNPMDDYDFNF